MNFAVIPSDLRTPGFVAEVSNAAANSAVQRLRTLCVGQKLSAGTAPANIPLIVTSVTQANVLFGRGSMLARMCIAAMVNDPNGELWGLPLTDDGAATPATGTVTFTGTTTAAGVFYAYFAGQLVKIPIESGKTATEQATAWKNAVNSALDLPITGDSDGNAFLWAARNGGYVGNGIDVRVNYAGAQAGEFLPAGTSLAFANLGTGATDPAVATAIANMSDTLFDFIALPYADSASTTILDAFATELNNLVGRWSPMRAVYGHVYSVKTLGATPVPCDVSSLGTYGNTRNDPHATIAGIAKAPTPSWEICAALAATAAQSIKIHPSQPTQSLILSGVLAPAAADRFSRTDRNTLLFDGIASLRYDSTGNVCIERDITTYRVNSDDAPDNSYLDSNTLHQLAFGLRYRQAQLTSKFPRAILVDSVNGLNPNVPSVVSPVTLKAEEFRIYDDLVAMAIYQDAADFKANFVISRNFTAPPRIDETNPPYLATPLRVLAALSLFRV